jgi:hypothetical protein
LRVAKPQQRNEIASNYHRGIFHDDRVLRNELLKDEVNVMLLLLSGGAPLRFAPIKIQIDKNVRRLFFFLETNCLRHPLVSKFVVGSDVLLAVTGF